MPTIRGYGRLVNQPQLYQKLLDIYPSQSNALEFCMGTLQEMTEVIFTKLSINIASRMPLVMCISAML